MNWSLWGDCVTNFLCFFFAFGRVVRTADVIFTFCDECMWMACFNHIYHLFHVDMCVVYFVAASALSKRAFRLLHIKCGMCVACHIPYFYFIAIICDDAIFSASPSTLSTFECSFNSVSITIETFACVKIHSLFVQVLSLRVTSIECMTRKRNAKLSIFFARAASWLVEPKWKRNEHQKIRQFASI